MATTKPNRVGKIREKLSELLAAEGLLINPEKLDSQIPMYATPQWDCCSWSGDGIRKSDGLQIHVSSWDTMTECVRYGIDVSQDDTWHTQYEVSRKAAKSVVG